MKDNYLHITHTEINKCIKTYALTSNCSTKYSGLYPILRGGLIPASYLSYYTALPIHYTLQEDSLIVDDICDTGNTLSIYSKHDKLVLINTSNNTNVISLLNYNKKLWYVFPWEDQDEQAIMKDKARYEAESK